MFAILGVGYGKRGERANAKHGWLLDRRLDAYTRWLKLQSELRDAFNAVEVRAMVGPTHSVNKEIVSKLGELDLVTREICLLGSPDVVKAAEDLKSEVICQMFELDSDLTTPSQVDRDTADRMDVWREAAERFANAATAALG